MATLQLCLFDDRRGDAEGQEADKVLGFFPSSVSEHAQTALVGLVQAILTFCRTFDEEPCSAVTTEQGQWVVHSCEPHIWLVLTADKAWYKGPSQAGSLQACLRQLQQVAALLHGPVQGLLSKDESGALARKAMGEVLAEFGDRLLRRRGPEYMSLLNPLAAHSAPPMLKLPQPLLLGVQSLVSRLMVAHAWGGAPPLGAALLHEHWLLWSTLAPADTQALHAFFRWLLLPGIRAAASYFGSRFMQPRLGSAAPSLCSRGSWVQDGQGAQHLAGSYGSCEPPPGQQAAQQLPSLWIQGLQEWASLLAVRVGEQLLLLLVPEGAAAPAAVETCLAATTPLLKRLHASVTQHLQHVRRQHVPTYRYMFEDAQVGASQASPGSKVATLGRASLELAQSVREAAAGAEQQEDGGWREVAARGEADCWAVARRSGQRSLLVVLEQQGVEGLREACGSVDAFADKHFPGML